MRLAAGLHRDFIRLALDNSLTRPGTLSVLGTPVDLGKVDVESYVLAGLSDHIVPWENAYRGALLFGRAARFVLVNERPHPVPRQPAGPRHSCELPHERRASSGSRGVAGRLAAQPGELVAELHGLAVRTIGQAGAGGEHLGSSTTSPPPRRQAAMCTRRDRPRRPTSAYPAEPARACGSDAERSKSSQLEHETARVSGPVPSRSACDDP